MTRTTVAIVGAGFGGVCMGTKLKRYGIPFTILEKADRVGGVWRDNVYPGAACDIPSHLYCYSFEPSHDWSRTYGQAAEIQSYIEHCARKYGVLDHVRFGAEVTRSSTRSTTSGSRTAKIRWSPRPGSSASRPSRASPASTASEARSSTPRAGTTTTR